VTRQRKIRVKGVRREEIDTETAALVFWLMAKARLREQRQQEQRAKEREQRHGQ
jgi:hypothetical protein